TRQRSRGRAARQAGGREGHHCAGGPRTPVATGGGWLGAADRGRSDAAGTGGRRTPGPRQQQNLRQNSAVQAEVRHLNAGSRRTGNRARRYPAVSPSSPSALVRRLISSEFV